jgi:GntR family transcriptional regulator
MDGSFIQVAPLSLHGQVMQDLLARIFDGRVKAGDALPTEEELCRQFGVSRITVRRAIADLAVRGLVSRKRGVGSFVTGRTHGLRTIHLTGFLDESRPFETRALLDHDLRADEETARTLDVPKGTVVRHLRSLVHFDGEPYTVSDSFTHLDAGPVTVDSDGKRLGYQIERAEQELDAVAADAVLAKQLGLKRGTPVMRARRVYFSVSRRPIQYLVVRYHSAHYRFVVDLLSRGGASTYQVTAAVPPAKSAGGKPPR